MKTVIKVLSVTLFAISFRLLAQPTQPLNSWAMGAPMPTARISAYIGAVGRKIYVIGGRAHSNLYGVNEVYDTVTDTWSTAAPMPIARNTGAGAVVNNILYVMGGSDSTGTITNLVDAYDPSTDKWFTKAAMPVKINSFNATVNNGIIYVVGGYDGNNRLNSIYSYNPSSNTWSTLPAMKAGRSMPAVAPSGSMIVVAGGLSTDSSNATTDNEAFNTLTNTWTSLAPLPTARDNSCFEVTGGLIYTASGDIVSGSGTLKTMDAYNPSTNTWTTGLPTIPVGVSQVASANVGGRLYCFGGTSTGQNGPNATIYNTVQIYQPLVAAPAIATGGLVSASAFGNFSSAAPGSWIEIYGSSLAGDTRSWAQSDFNGNAAPTVLDGTTVSIAGQPAFVEYISPTQINVQLPSNLSTGTQQLTVTTFGGSSASYPITINATRPGLLAPTSFNVSGMQYAVAFFPDGATYVLPPATIAGLSSQRASPGQTITLYGVGFGPVTPSIAAGQITGGSNSLTGTLQISIGGASATLSYAGLVPGYVGLYQFNVIVPDIAPGTAVPLTFTLNGVPSTQTLFTAVGN